MVVICNFCGKTLSTKASLERHKKTNACKKIHETIPENSDNISCNYCGKTVDRKHRLSMHLEKCEIKKKIMLLESDINELKDRNREQEITIMKYEQDIDNLTEQVDDLKIQCESKDQIIADIAKQPKRTNTTNLIIPIIDTTQEKIAQTVDASYSLDHFYNGQKGVAMFAKEYILSDDQKQLGYVCTDAARFVFKHMSIDGEIIRDIKANRLTKKLSKPITEKAGKYAYEIINEGNIDEVTLATQNFNDIASMNSDNSVFRNELITYTSLES